MKNTGKESLKQSVREKQFSEEPCGEEKEKKILIHHFWTYFLLSKHNAIRMNKNVSEKKPKIINLISSFPNEDIEKRNDKWLKGENKLVGFWESVDVVMFLQEIQLYPKSLCTWKMILAGIFAD